MKRGKINRDTKYINEQKWVMKLRKRIKILYRFIGTNMNQQNRSHCHHYLEFRERLSLLEGGLLLLLLLLLVFIKFEHVVVGDGLLKLIKFERVGVCF